MWQELIEKKNRLFWGPPPVHAEVFLKDDSEFTSLHSDLDLPKVTLGVSFAIRTLVSSLAARRTGWTTREGGSGYSWLLVLLCTAEMPWYRPHLYQRRLAITALHRTHPFKQDWPFHQSFDLSVISSGRSEYHQRTKGCLPLLSEKLHVDWDTERWRFAEGQLQSSQQGMGNLHW